MRPTITILILTKKGHVGERGEGGEVGERERKVKGGHTRAPTSCLLRGWMLLKGEDGSPRSMAAA